MGKFSYFVKSGMLRLMVEENTATVKSKETRRVRKKKKVSKRKEDKWEELRKRFAWVGDLLEKSQTSEERFKEV